MKDNFSKISFDMKNAVFAAGDILTDGFGKCISDAQKKDNSLGSKYAEQSGRVIESSLLKSWFAARKDDIAVITDGVPKLAKSNGASYTIEEFGDIQKYAGPCFCISCLEAGEAFERGIRDFCIGIAYLEDMQVKASVVFDPVNVELFHAVLGLGAYLNGKFIEVSKTEHTADAYISIGHEALRKADPEALSMLCKKALCVRTGATCGLELCYTACGRIDAAIKANQSFCDYVPGLLIAKEAGAKISLLKGGAYEGIKEMDERQSVIASCPKIAGELADTTSLF